MLKITELRNQFRPFVNNYVAEFWGSLLVVTKGKVYNLSRIDGYVALIDDDIKGVLTYDIDGKTCNIISLNSLDKNIGIGTALIEKMETMAKKFNCKKISIVATNDNTNAMRFFQKRGYCMYCVHKNTVERTRRIKPNLPKTGFDNIPVYCELEFIKKLEKETLVLK